MWGMKLSEASKSGYSETPLERRANRARQLAEALLKVGGRETLLGLQGGEGGRRRASAERWVPAYVRFLCRESPEWFALSKDGMVTLKPEGRRDLLPGSLRPQDDG